MSETIVIALGGNAITGAGETGTAAEQLRNVDVTARQIAAILQRGARVIVTHGNGPQVGALLLQQEGARDSVPEQPLHVCGAMTQGHLGWMLQNRIRFHVRKSGVRAPVATVVTQVVVDKDDPDFHEPSKPVGPFYSEDEARKLEQEKGYLVKEVKPKSKQGWRRIVPSPMPQDILEKTAIRSLVSAGMVVVASGGGGIPVYSDEAGDHIGVDAVIDKDRAAVCLAELVEADRFIILTDVPNVLLNYNTPEQQTLETVSLREMDEYIAQGHFLAGSMGPKVEAAVRFARQTGKVATITSLDYAVEGFTQSMGTQVVP